jgi:hypothetical protein
MVSWMKVSLFFGMCLLVCGCGVSDDRVSIKGTVFCDDKPLAGASVAFAGTAFGTSVTDSEGNFTMRASVGKNKVSIAKADPNAALPSANSSANDSIPTEGEYAKKKPTKTIGCRAIFRSDQIGNRGRCDRWHGAVRSESFFKVIWQFADYIFLDLGSASSQGSFVHSLRGDLEPSKLS